MPDLMDDDDVIMIEPEDDGMPQLPILQPYVPIQPPAEVCTAHRLCNTHSDVCMYAGFLAGATGSPPAWWQVDVAHCGQPRQAGAGL